ncbi:hypothetical protein IV203_028142 [Nitzschia inconspicua]|uniref:Uncharacterized protein n=1 Tax=Nitzschia inconspicua TaxID=303405 RepID=A0A9K3M193_9STRA|nr:hypothetical protein IV203_028142 [Nitzschia inconspicua]
MARKRYIICQKLRMLDEVDTRLQQGSSLCSDAASLGVQPTRPKFVKWRVKRPAMQQCSRKNKSICKGRESAIERLEQPLIGW